MHGVFTTAAKDMEPLLMREQQALLAPHAYASTLLQCLYDWHDQ
jgi:hypothetical protein